MAWILKIILVDERSWIYSNICPVRRCLYAIRTRSRYFASEAYLVDVFLMDLFSRGGETERFSYEASIRYALCWHLYSTIIPSARMQSMQMRKQTSTRSTWAFGISLSILMFRWCVWNGTSWTSLNNRSKLIYLGSSGQPMFWFEDYLFIHVNAPVAPVLRPNAVDCGVTKWGQRTQSDVRAGANVRFSSRISAKSPFNPIELWIFKESLLYSFFSNFRHYSDSI